MIRWVVLVVASCLGVCLGACGAELTAAGAQVRVGKGAPEGESCQELGIVYGSGSGGGYTSAEAKLQWAQNELRNKTAQAGGNFVIMDASAGDVAGISMSGRALRCEPGSDQPPETASAPPPPAARAEATKAEPTKAEPSSGAAESHEQRLRALEDLHKKGLVTDEEYQQRRKAIIDSI